MTSVENTPTGRVLRQGERKSTLQNTTESIYKQQEQEREAHIQASADRVRAQIVQARVESLRGLKKAGKITDAQEQELLTLEEKLKNGTPTKINNKNDSVTSLHDELLKKEFDSAPAKPQPTTKKSSYVEIDTVRYQEDDTYSEFVDLTLAKLQTNKKLAKLNENSLEDLNSTLKSKLDTALLLLDTLTKGEEIEQLNTAIASLKAESKTQKEREILVEKLAAIESKLANYQDLSLHRAEKSSSTILRPAASMASTGFTNPVSFSGAVETRGPAAKKPTD